MWLWQILALIIFSICCIFNPAHHRYVQGKRSTPTGLENTKFNNRIICSALCLQQWALEDMEEWFGRRRCRRYGGTTYLSLHCSIVVLPILAADPRDSIDDLVSRVKEERKNGELRRRADWRERWRSIPSTLMKPFCLITNLCEKSVLYSEQNKEYTNWYRL